MTASAERFGFASIPQHVRTRLTSPLCELFYLFLICLLFGRFLD
jgi:hypothetical protein